MKFFVVTLLSCAVVVLCKNVQKSDHPASFSHRTNDLKNCEQVKSFFEMRNITVRDGKRNSKEKGVENGPLHPPEEIGSTCNGACCGELEEAQLRLHVQQDFASLLRHNSRSLQGQLSTTATILNDHIMELTSQSETQTLHLFAQVYERMAVLSQEPIKTLYSDIKKYLIISEKDVTFAPSNLDIKSSVNQFFTNLFPLVYHHVINSHSQDFTHDYKICLKQAFNELQPFGDIPRQISISAFKSLEATRVLLQAFAVGVEILNATDTLLVQQKTIDDNGKDNDACHQALLKMTYCPKCRGLLTHTKPCSGYCLNVLRGCLTQHVTELDSAWNEYVNAIERLVLAVKQHGTGVNVDAVIRSLDSKISDAIMYAMENGPTLEKKVKLTCGHATLSEKEDSLVVGHDEKSHHNSSRSTSEHISSLQTTPPDTQLLQFLSSVVKSRGFYATLADNLCRDEAFAETRDGRECWNGQRIGEYTETVVDASLSMQRYNPEVRPNKSQTNPQIAGLADKLRHVSQVVVSSLGSTSFPKSDSYMQGDASEGSGSGIPKYSTSESDDENIEGSGGSGDHNTDSEHRSHNTKSAAKPKPVPPQPEKPERSSGSHIKSTYHLITLFIIVGYISSHFY